MTPPDDMQPNIRELPFGVRFWILIAVLGVIIGLSAAALMALLRLVQHTAWHYEYGVFLDGVNQTSALHRVLVLLGAGILGGGSMWLIGRWNRWKSISIDRAIWKNTGHLPFVQGLCVAVLSMVLVGLGEPLGRERSVKQAGSLFGSKLAELAKLNLNEWRVLTALGSAAGMGAVYNMPVGGALYALEVLLGEFSLRTALAALALGAIATGVSWIVIPASPTYTISASHLWLPQILWACVAAPLFGVASAGYVHLIAFVEAHKARKNALLAAPVVVFTILGAVAIAYPQILGNGKDIVQIAFTGSMSLDLVLVLVVLRPLAAASCIVAGMPGGLFTPTLTFGALVGTVFGAAWSSFWPGAPIGTYAIIGAGAMVGAATQGPISAVVMMTELTGSIDPLIVPLVIATAGASLTSRLLARGSIYSPPERRALDPSTLR
jgi:chloride channel protein, CIC family